MTFIETFATSLTALKANKARSFLTMLGVIIGVFAVVTLVSIGIGFQNYLKSQFDALGSNLIFVIPGKANFADDPAKSFTGNKLDEKHLELIEKYAGDFLKQSDTDGSYLLSPSIRVGKSVEFKSKKYYGTLSAGNVNAQYIFNIKVADGRYFTNNEIKSKSRVAVLGPNVVAELFPNRSPIGQKVNIENIKYDVIGVLEKKSADFDDNIYVPYTSAMQDFDIKNFSSIALKSKNENNVQETMREVKTAMLHDLSDDRFSVLSQEDVLSSIQNVLKIVTTGIGAIAGISLIVGGIGIMNIMLVSVTERIKEIGLRKALGATSYNIALQFLMESVVLSVSGGGIGLLLGWLASLAARVYVQTAVPWWAVALSFGFSVLVGMIFGTYPAIQASKKDPIEALRYE